MAPPIVKMRDIHKWFGHIHALQGVDLSIASGESLGLVGENGAGKSTLIKTLSGVYQPDKGEIFIMGKKTWFNSPMDARNSGIETVYQEQALVDSLTVARNVFLGKELTKRIGPIKFLDIEKMKEESKRILKHLGLHISSMDQTTEYCSGGEKQGIAISRAVLFRSDLVILDEPTRALGVSEVAQILDFVKGLKKRKIAIIFITHNLYHVYPVADRFIVLSRGRKVADVKKEKTSIKKLNNIMIEKR